LSANSFPIPANRRLKSRMRAQLIRSSGSSATSLLPTPKTWESIGNQRNPWLRRRFGLAPTRRRSRWSVSRRRVPWSTPATPFRSVLKWRIKAGGHSQPGGRKSNSGLARAACRHIRRPGFPVATAVAFIP